MSEMTATHRELAQGRRLSVVARDPAVFGELTLASYAKDRACLTEVLANACAIEALAVSRKVTMAAGVMRQMCEERLREIPKEEEYVRNLIARWQASHE